MRQLGWVEGRNLAVVARAAEGQVARLPGLAADLASQRVDVVVALSTEAGEQARSATRTIPIVMLFALDPVKAGLAQSVARPGGNVTGVMWADPGFTPKSFQVFKQAVPGIKRLGVLYAPSTGIESYIDAAKAVARDLGLTLVYLKVTHISQVPEALATAKRERVDALRASTTGFLRPAMDQILDFARSARIPVSANDSFWVEQGALLSYIPSGSQIAALGAQMVDRILRGATPSDMPFQYPTKYELTINLKTAKALGLTIPQSVLLQADRVIE